MDEQKKAVLDFLKTQYLGVISTIDSKSNKPESALMAFAETANLEIIFGTMNDTRKFENMKNNPNISFVFGFDHVSIQYEGVAKITDGEEAKQCEQILTAKNPNSQKYASDPREKYFKITPRWLRYSDFSFDPEKVFEISF